MADAHAVDAVASDVSAAKNGAVINGAAKSDTVDTSAAIHDDVDDSGSEPDPPRAIDAIDGRVRSFVSERPGLALFGAIACGFIIGRIASR